MRKKNINRGTETQNSDKGVRQLTANMSVYNGQWGGHTVNARLFLHQEIVTFYATQQL